MILELLENEIRNLYPKNYRHLAICEDEYELHCSGTFAMLLMKSVLDIGFDIPPIVQQNLPEVTMEAVQTENTRFTKYKLPTIGYIKVITDMDHGYRIVKIKKFKEGMIVKRDFTSRQSWIIRDLDGKLMAVPNTNSHNPDTEPIEPTQDMIILADTNGLDFSSSKERTGDIGDIHTDSVLTRLHIGAQVKVLIPDSNGIPAWVDASQSSRNNDLQILHTDPTTQSGPGSIDLTSHQGLTVLGDDVKLGGTLTEGTTIKTNNFDLTNDNPDT